jgi:phosphatidylserine/phosphatidylglycerophosphate/cardiolipin synthase-like enzyme
LLNEETFYPSFLKDLGNCQREVIIESPFITHRRLCMLLPTLEKLKARKVRVAINTKNPDEHDNSHVRLEATEALATLQHLGIQVLYTSGHHRKLAILDRKVLYEGSLNILSQNNSCEVMRRIESVSLAWQMVRFADLDRLLA